jgi:lysozyme
VTGEWLGESLDNLGPAYKNKISTAAGKYQILKRSWLEGKEALGLKDFSPDSQDKWATWKIKQRGALDEVEKGAIRDAILLCRKEWASLPGSNYGQHENKMEKLISLYVGFGGVLA